jgi:hypothetical protein
MCSVSFARVVLGPPIQLSIPVLFEVFMDMTFLLLLVPPASIDATVVFILADCILAGLYSHPLSRQSMSFTF